MTTLLQGPLAKFARIDSWREYVLVCSDVTLAEHPEHGGPGNVKAELHSAMPNLNLIGDRVRKRREARSMTQDQLAGACQRAGWDISRVTLTKIETGVRAVNDGEIVVLASVLKCEPGELFAAVALADALSVVRQGANAG